MDEQEMQEILKQKLEVPELVNKKLEEAYARLEGGQRSARRLGLRAARTALIAAAVAAALCVTATAAYSIFRQEVPMDEGGTIQGILDGGQPSWEQREIYGEDGMMEAKWPNRETVDVDPAQAQALLGDCLPASGYQWQIGDYTFTLEGYVLDEHTGTAKVYYSMEHPGGFPEGSVDQTSGTLTYKSGISVIFAVKTDADRAYLNGNITHVDMDRSTAEKLYLMDGGAGGGSWKAEDGLLITVRIFGGTARDEDMLSAELEVPGVKSLSPVSVADPATGGTAVELSPIAIALHCGNKDYVGYLALDYADGTRYVVRDDASRLDNTDYGCGWGEYPNITLVYVFNRLVDPSQVAAVTVDGQRYELR